MLDYVYVTYDRIYACIAAVGISTFCIDVYIYTYLLTLLNFFLVITLLAQRDPKQRFLSTSVGRSLIDDDEDDEDDRRH